MMRTYLRLKSKDSVDNMGQLSSNLPPSGISIVRDARTVFMVKEMRVACQGAGADYG